MLRVVFGEGIELDIHLPHAFALQDPCQQHCVFVYKRNVLLLVSVIDKVTPVDKILVTLHGTYYNCCKWIRRHNEPLL